MNSGIVSLATFRLIVSSPWLSMMVSGLLLPKAPASSSLPVCPACMEGKQTRDPFPPVTSRHSVPLELVHSDLHGPLPPTGQWLQVLGLIHRCLSIPTLLLHTKSEAFSAFKHYKSWAEKQTGKSIKALRDDKGGIHVGTWYREVTHNSCYPTAEWGC